MLPIRKASLQMDPFHALLHMEEAHLGFKLGKTV